MSLTGRGSAEGWGGAGGGGSREPAAKRAGFIAGSASAPEGAEGIPTRAFFSFIFGEDQSLLSAKRRHAARDKTKGRDRDRFGVVADPEYSHRATLGAPDDPRERVRSRRARMREEARVEVEARALEFWPSRLPRRRRAAISSFALISSKARSTTAFSPRLVTQRCARARLARDRHGESAPGSRAMTESSKPTSSTAGDGKDCDKPVCAVKDDMFAMMKTAAKRRSGGADADAPSSSSSGADTPCPVDKEELGRGSWALLHTLAAYYPDKPDALYRVQARRFFDALGTLYPCEHCAADFREDMGREPPDVRSRESLALWLCRRHNEVNEKLGKPMFPCVLKDLDARWLKGGSDCWHG